ncbi:MAG: hypothetical protein V4687_08275 [Bacteroidota bacterium]
MKALYYISLIAIASGCGVPKKYQSSKKLVKEHLCVECNTGANQAKPPAIKHSKSDVELRLTSRGHAGTASTIAITHNEGVYQAFLYMHETQNAVYKKTNLYVYPAFKYKIIGYRLDSVLQALTDLGLYTLPSQSITKIPYFGSNTVEFKNKGEFGSFNFGFLSDIRPRYPNEQLYGKYNKVYELFRSITKEAYERYNADMKVESKRHNKDYRKAKRERKNITSNNAKTVPQ